MTDSPAGKAPLWVAYERLAMVLGLGVLALCCLIWLPFAMLLHPLLPRRIGQSIGRLVARVGFRGYLAVLGWLCACRFDLEELDQLRGAGPLLLAANHPSLLDAVLILSRVPDTVCIMKAELMDNLLFGAAARLARFIRNDAPLAMILDAGEELRQGAHLLIFPEGTRTTTFPVNSCLPTVGLVARRNRVAVQVLLIEFSTPYLGKHWPLFRRPELPFRCRIRPGRRFTPPEDVAVFRAELENHFRAELSEPWPATVTGPALVNAHKGRRKVC